MNTATPGDAGVFESADEVRQRGVEGRQLHGDGDVDGGDDRGDDLQLAVLDVGAGLVEVGGEVVEVQLDGIGAAVGESGGRCRSTRRG